MKKMSCKKKNSVLLQIFCYLRFQFKTCGCSWSQPLLCPSLGNKPSFATNLLYIWC